MEAWFDLLPRAVAALDARVVARPHHPVPSSRPGYAIAWCLPCGKQIACTKGESFVRMAFVLPHLLDIIDFVRGTWHDSADMSYGADFDWVHVRIPHGNLCQARGESSTLGVLLETRRMREETPSKPMSRSRTWNTPGIWWMAKQEPVV